MIYTFTGTVTSLNDVGGAGASAGLFVGAPVRYEVLIDFEADGIVQTYGVDEVQVDEADAYYIRDYFYAEYLGGTTLATDFEVFQLLDRLNFVGLNETAIEADREQGSLYLGNLLTFGGGGGFVLDWGIGTSITAAEHWTVGSDGGLLIAAVTLDEIQPAPEPHRSVMLLAGIGMMGALYRRRIWGSSA
jgi:hypothetical protein